MHELSVLCCPIPARGSGSWRRLNRSSQERARARIVLQGALSSDGSSPCATAFCSSIASPLSKHALVSSLPVLSFRKSPSLNSCFHNASLQESPLRRTTYRRKEP